MDNSQPPICDFFYNENESRLYELVEQTRQDEE